MVIIIEGVDRVGKSTLASKLSTKLNCPIFHDRDLKDYSKFDSGATDYKFRDRMRHIKTCKKDYIIYDRFHLTELVYDSLRGQEFASYNKVDKELNRQRVMLILVVSEDIAESSRQHGSSLEVHEKEFIKAFNKSKIDCKFKVKYKDFDSMIKRVFGV